ncbi:MAG: ATP-binding cassette domain-containing protein, partial [candidate division Zixibacteria bacterium]|nr:ABC transporter ATP-binding protein [candidate division Zixibacteria bacterium]NIR51137.1 ABC transporter ATP-binding protein [candidate division KSB1 bacterium]NIR62963.1 ABC transporter ATP-binding protein [candidate division Zixibacteria bacterium]NIS44984.1 ABC transporter ATP-binding protein [candidate division Zixibacteria bacterium]NIT73356.1 ABC transporter ATP-binding protein [candidate division KSB1 bacterium]
MEEKKEIIQTHEITKRFNGTTAVEDLSFSVEEGTIFGFIGPSGSGKTTTIRMLTGYYRPTEGELSVFGSSPAEFSRSERERIGYLPQLFGLYPNLTVWENLNFAASLYGLPLFRKRRLFEELDFVELRDARGKLARDLSAGMQRRLNLAATLLHKPDLIFLDEPTAGVDPVLRRKFWDHFRHLKADGRTLFITTQYVSEAIYCDLVALIDRGRLVIINTPAMLRREA